MCYIYQHNLFVTPASPRSTNPMTSLNKHEQCFSHHFSWLKSKHQTIWHKFSLFYHLRPLTSKQQIDKSCRVNKTFNEIKSKDDCDAKERRGNRTKNDKGLKAWRQKNTLSATTIIHPSPSKQCLVEFHNLLSEFIHETATDCWS